MSVRAASSLVFCMGLVVVAAGSVRSARAQPARFQGLGFLVGGPPASSAAAISADGSTVAGLAGSYCDAQAVRWTAATGWQVMLAAPPNVGLPWVPVAVSADGSVVAGTLATGGCGGTGSGARWTAGRGAESLGAPGPAAGVSGNGALIVGYS